MPPLPNTALAAIPRSLHLSPSTAVTRSHLLALYREELRVAHSFKSYNFKEYFVRRTRDKFRSELPALLDAAYAQDGRGAAPATLSSPSSSSTASASPSAAPSSSAPPSSESESEGTSIYTPTSTPSSASNLSSSAGTPQERLRAWYSDGLVELGVMARSAVINRMYEAPKLVIETRRPSSRTSPSSDSPSSSTEHEKEHAIPVGNQPWPEGGI